MCVLLVGDDRLIGSGVEDGLTEAGMTVDWAHDGRPAQLALETTLYDLVVLDLGLSRMSGTELLDWIRKPRPYAGTRHDRTRHRRRPGERPERRRR